MCGTAPPHDGEPPSPKCGPRLRNPALAPSHARCPPSGSQLPEEAPPQEEPGVFPPRVALRGLTQRERRGVLRRLSRDLARAGAGADKRPAPGVRAAGKTGAERFAGKRGKKTGSQSLKAEQGVGRGRSKNGREEEQGGELPHAESAKPREEARPVVAQSKISAGELSCWHSGKQLSSKTRGLSQLRWPSYSQPKAGRDQARQGDSGGQDPAHASIS